MASTCPSPDYANASIFQKYDSTNGKQALLMSTEKYNNSFISLNVYNATGNPVNELKADGETISQICYKEMRNKLVCLVKLIPAEAIQADKLEKFRAMLYQQPAV